MMEMVPAEELLNDIERGLAAGAFYLSLYAALTLPDVAAALESDDGRTTGSRYVAWVDRHIAPKYVWTGAQGSPEVQFTGHDCWGIRCSMLHQSRSAPNAALGT